MFGGIKVNENWRKRYNKVVMLLSGDLVALSFVRVSRLCWIGHVNRKESKRKEVKQLTVILREVDYEDDQKQMAELCTNTY